MTKLHTHYDNLKVARNAPPKVIRAAYKRLSQKFHPDKNPGNIEAAQIMTIINASYKVLSDPDKRREHDEWIAGMETASSANRQTSRSSYSTTQYSAHSVNNMALLEILLPIFNPIKGIVVWTFFYVISIGVLTGIIWLIGSAVDHFRGKS
ncbi:J domain-containing protein [Nitrosomonas communis]|uniref:J domain-containing protein n=1 Tax=Nitrosomonas communis TaxID=44574 RepID=UPI0026E9C85E|nr:J domain-containing protein [Nitrosomonas communis]MCO6428840.1 J domain-containing protein [Nitrosomonas communis]